MANAFSSMNLTAVMAWVHLALMAVPLIIFTIYMEVQSWKHDHPKVAQQKQKVPRRRPAVLQPHPAV